MENNNQNILVKKHKMVCEDRKVLSLTAVEKVESSNENQVVCIISKSPVLITGKQLHVNKLDVEQGIVEITGEVDMIKYHAERKPILKRLFK